MEGKNEQKNLGFLKTAGLFVFEVVKIAVIAAVVVFVIRTFLIQPFFVKGSSMEPNFKDGEYLIIEELSYRFGEAERGEVIVFRYPRDPDQFYIKRIIGLPGEKIEIKKNKVITYNEEYPQGNTLNEDYIESPGLTSGDREVTLKEDEYFVMGDNRMASSDSRSWGPLKEKFIVGKVFIRAFPFGKFKVFNEAKAINY